MSCHGFLLCSNWVSFGHINICSYFSIIHEIPQTAIIAPAFLWAYISPDKFYKFTYVLRVFLWCINNMSDKAQAFSIFTEMLLFYKPITPHRTSDCLPGWFIKNNLGKFPGGAVDKNPSANAGDTSSIPGLGAFHMMWRSWAWAPELQSPCSTAHAPQQGKPQQWEDHSLQLESRPHSCN